MIWKKVIYEKNIQVCGATLQDFMLLEYNYQHELKGRIDGKIAKLGVKKWYMTDLLLTKKNEEPIFYTSYEYDAYINKEDIKKSLSSPEMMSVLQLGTFIQVKGVKNLAGFFKIFGFHRESI